MTKIEINREELIKTISVAGVMAGRCRMTPILDNVKCVVKGDAIIITSFNNEIAVTSKCALMSATQDVSFCIEPKALLDFVRLLGNEETVSFEVDDEVSMATITHKHGKMSFPLFSVDDFPSPVKEESEGVVDMPADTIYEWIKNSQKFVSHHDVNPVLCSMYLYIKDGECGYCATDTQKMITDSIAFQDKDIDKWALIPATAFDAILSVVSKGKDMKIKFTKKTIVFYCDGSAVMCMCTVGMFPNFKAILPKNTPIKVDGMFTSLFYESALRTSLGQDVKSGGSNKVQFTLGEDKIVLQTSNLMNGKESFETLPCQCGANLSIAFNCDYLKDVLSCVNSDIIELMFTDERHPMIIKEKDNENKTILLMPRVLKK